MAEVHIPHALPEGTVEGSGAYAVGNNGEHFAVTRRCRHLRADLANGSIDEDGCLVCPWHKAKYDTATGRMVRGPQEPFNKYPGLSWAFTQITKVWPLGRASVVIDDQE